MRGTPARFYTPTDEQRFIPARAGNTPQAGRPDRRRRFIPARAGNTYRVNVPVPAESVHPRACGEHPIASETFASTNGSSPRVRGTHACSRFCFPRSRFIPARAGNTEAARSASSIVRFIPARAGNTMSKRYGRTIQTVHPRACGNTKLRNSGEARPRFIPARAGNTLGDIWRDLPLAVHPRACGEHSVGQSAMLWGFGSSPRVRGTPFSPRLHRADSRFIPARAGNTPATSPRHVCYSVHPRACGEHFKIPASN